ncbi:tryptophan halogenase, partial [Streptomyces sp. NPDC059627]
GGRGGGGGPAAGPHGPGAVGRLAIAGDRTNPLLTTRVVTETFRTGNDLQEQALYGAPLDGPVLPPSAPGALGVTEDGLSWLPV